MLKNEILQKFKYLIFFITIFCLQFLMFVPIMSENPALLSRDPYLWTSLTIKLLRNGFIGKDLLQNFYPYGFVFINGGNLLLFQNFYINYYFMKFASLPFLNLYSILVFYFLKNFFKNYILLLSSLVLLISNIIFTYRTILYLSSSYAIFLILIIFMLFKTKLPKALIGLFIPAIFLINPLYSLLITLNLVIFYILNYSINYHEYKRISKELVQILLLSFLFLIPYFLNLVFIRGEDFITIIKVFLRDLLPRIVLNYNNSLIIKEKYTLLSINTFMLIKFSEIFYLILFLILPIIGFILVIIKRKYREEIDILIISCFFIVYFIGYINVLSFFNIIFSRWNNRVIEAFLFAIIYGSIFFFSWFIQISKIYMPIIISKINYVKKKVKINKNKIKFFNLSNIVSILILSSILATYFYSKENFKYYYHYDDSLINCIFYIEKNYQNDLNISVDRFDVNYRYTPYTLIDQHNIIYNPLNYNISIYNYYDFIKNNHVNLIIIKLSSYNNNFYVQFVKNMSFIKMAGGPDQNYYQLYKVI